MVPFLQKEVLSDMLQFFWLPSYSEFAEVAWRVSNSDLGGGSLEEGVLVVLVTKSVFLADVWVRGDIWNKTFGGFWFIGHWLQVVQGQKSYRYRLDEILCGSTRKVEANWKSKKEVNIANCWRRIVGLAFLQLFEREEKMLEILWDPLKGTGLGSILEEGKSEEEKTSWDQEEGARVIWEVIFDLWLISAWQLPIETFLSFLIACSQNWRRLLAWQQIRHAIRLKFIADEM